MRARRSRFVPALVLATTAAVGATLVSAPATAGEERSAVVRGSEVSSVKATTKKAAKRSVMVVGNNWEGTVTIVDATTRKSLKTINVVPDLDEELQQVMTPSPSHPLGPAYYVAIQQVVAEGHDQYVDDIFTTRNGRFLAVSRPSLHDVVWIDIRKAAAGGKGGDVDSIVAEQEMDGYRTDHMGISPDRRRLLVSDSTAKQVIEFSMVGRSMGKRLRSFESGETPHENNYSEDGSRIFHASIGRVYTPMDYPGLGLVQEDIDDEFVHDSVKADRWLQIVDNATFDVTHRWDMGLELEEAGHPEMSSAVRPVAITPNEKVMYAQVSFFHGLVEFNMVKPDVKDSADYTLGGLAEPEVGRVTRLIDLPIAEEVEDMRREEYVLDSAHHGLAINKNGRKLCVAGTMSDYAAIVDRKTFTPKIFKGAPRYLKKAPNYSKPYWATEGPGNTCWLSMSGSDLVTVISFGKEKVVAEVKVGDHPQRVREGHVREAIVRSF